MTVTDAPTAELGHPGGLSPILGAAGAGFYVDGLEVNADLRFPASAVVYDRMRNEDGQVGSVARAITLPILGAKRRLVGEDVRPEVLAFVENELGLNLEAGKARRRREGIVLGDHFREALLALWFGFMPFEQVYQVGPAAPGLEDPAQPGRLYAHLRKLAPRMPRTLTEVRVARDGGLAGIVQEPPPAARGHVATRGIVIPVDRLVMYVNDKEGADWTGKSLLRSSYKHWLIKDALIRLGAQIVERNGMGIPVVKVDGAEHRAKGLALAKAFRAGATAGAVLEPGITSLDVVGVAGSTADELPRVKYHDESIGRSLLAMFLNLGHDNGARALGDTFVSVFRDSLNAVIRWLDDTATEHIIRDLVELNYGPEEPYPTLVTESLSESVTAESLKALAEVGLITPDRDLEQHLRGRYSLPAKPEPTGDQAVEDAAGSPVAEVGIPALIDAGVISPDEGRQMLKLPGSAPDRPPVPEDGVAEVIELPAAMAANLSAHRDSIRAYLGLTRITTGDYRLDDEGLEVTLVDRLAALTDRIAALRVGHGS